MRKKVVSVFLVLVMILSVMPTAFAEKITMSEFNNRVNAIQAKYGQGTSVSRIYGDDGYYRDSSGWGTQECMAWAYYMFYNVWKVSVRSDRTDVHSDVNRLFVGDYVRYRSTTSCDHSIFITKISGNDIYYTDGNGQGTNLIRYNVHTTKSQLQALLNKQLKDEARKGYIRHSWDNGLKDDPPTATLSINKVRINPNDSVTFTLGGKNVNGTFTLGIYRDNQRIETFTTGYNHTYTCTQPGNYSAYMTSYNDAGLADSNWVYWTVGQISAVLSVDKDKYSIHDNVIFSFTANNTINKFTLGIYKDGERIKTVDVEGDTYLYNILENGYYTAYMTAYNDSGLLDSNWVEWEVGSLNFQPQYTMIYNNHLYSVYDVNLSWKTAEKFCKEKGGHLATITTVEENNIIKELVKYGAKKYYMLGASDEKSKGVWEWVTGENFSYVDWYNGEPNNAGGVEHYLDIYSGLGWNDDCNYKLSSRGFILEIENQQSLSPFTTIKHGTYAEVINNTSKSQSATVIIAKYSNKKLKDTKIISTTFSANEEKSFSHSYGSDYKVFVWDSLEGMKPLAE